MKVDEPVASTSATGDSTAAESTTPDGLLKSSDDKPTDSKRARKEPLSEKLSNFSRVTPVQLGHITFPLDGRYQPVRPVTTRLAQKSSKSKAVANAGTKIALGSGVERYVGGGGILILIDQAPNEPAEFIETEVPRPAPAPATETVTAEVATPATDAPEAPRNIALDENEADAQPPESFEVCHSILDLLQEYLLTRNWMI